MVRSVLVRPKSRVIGLNKRAGKVRATVSENASRWLRESGSRSRRRKIHMYQKQHENEEKLWISCAQQIKPTSRPLLRRSCLSI